MVLLLLIFVCTQAASLREELVGHVVEHTKRQNKLFVEIATSMPNKSVDFTIDQLHEYIVHEAMDGKESAFIQLYPNRRFDFIGVNAIYDWKEEAIKSASPMGLSLKVDDLIEETLRQHLFTVQRIWNDKYDLKMVYAPWRHPMGFVFCWGKDDGECIDKRVKNEFLHMVPDNVRWVLC